MSDSNPSTSETNVEAVELEGNENDFWGTALDAEIATVEANLSPAAGITSETGNHQSVAAPALTIMTPADILALEFSDSDLFTADGILARGQFTGIVGPSGVGKSRFAGQLATCLATGHDFLNWGINTSGERVMIFQPENGARRVQHDLQRFLAMVGEDKRKLVEENLRIQILGHDQDGCLSLNEIAVVEAIVGEVKAFQPSVLVADPMSAFAMGNLNSDTAMLNTCRMLREIARAGNPGCAILALHHTLTGKAGIKKATGIDRASYGRNSKAFHAYARAVINLAPASAEHNDRLVVACGKNSNFPSFQTFGIRLNPTTLIYEVEPDFDLSVWRTELSGEVISKQKPTPESIAQFVSALPLKRKALLERVMETYGCGKSTAYTLIVAAEGTTIRLDALSRYEPIPTTDK